MAVVAKLRKLHPRKTNMEPHGTSKLMDHLDVGIYVCFHFPEFGHFSRFRMLVFRRVVMIVHNRKCGESLLFTKVKSDVFF